MKLSYLLEMIYNGDLALPDFQRDFVWDSRATEQLIESLCQSFPAGSLLRIKKSPGFVFAPREFAGAPTLGGHEPAYLILDGQQRLTSLYQALRGGGKHRYFISFMALLRGSDLEDSVFCQREATAQKEFGRIYEQAMMLTFPLQELTAPGGFEEWLDRILEVRQNHGELIPDVKQTIRELRRQWLEPLERYEFPMVTLAEDTSAEAVCTIFETLNRTGVKLSPFDLLAARFWPQNLRLRDLWGEAQQVHPIIADYEVEPYYVLQTLAMHCPKRTPSCKRKDVLDLTVEQVQSGWHAVVDGLAEVLALLRDHCGVFRPNLLPYSTMLIPMAATAAGALPVNGPRIAAAWNKIRRWYWCSVFGQAYENAPNSQAAADYAELTEWIKGGVEPRSVRQFRFDAESLRQITHHQRALYRGALALVLSGGALDFHTGKRLTPQQMGEGRVDDHHIFPRKHLEESHPTATEVERNCVLNRTFIDRQTDIRIGKRAPREYLGEIEEQLGHEGVTKLLRSHLMPERESRCYDGNDFDAFLTERGRLIGREIAEVTKA